MSSSAQATRPEMHLPVTHCRIAHRTRRSFRTFLSAQWEVIRAAARQLGCALPAPGPAGDCPGFEGIPVSTLDDHLSTAAQEIFLPWCEAEAQSLCDRAVQRASGMSGIGIALGSALHGAGGGGEAARREDAGRVGAASESAFSGNDGEASRLCKLWWRPSSVVSIVAPSSVAR